MYLPSPSCVIPRETVTPVFGTSANLYVSFGCAQIASERSLPTLSVDDVERGGELDVADVVAAEVHVHETGDELVLGGVLVVLDALEERVGAVADADDRDAHLSVRAPLAVAASVGLGHGVLSVRSESEPVAEGVDDQLVRGATAVGRALAEPLLELLRHAQQHLAPATARAALAAGRLEGNAEARGQDLDRDVVQVRAPLGDLVRQAALELDRHPDEHVCSLSRHDENIDSTKLLSLMELSPNC